MNMNSPIEGAELQQARPQARLSGWQRGALVAVPLALVGGGLLLANGGSADPAPAPPPPGVTVAAPLVREVNEWDDYTGRFEPSRSVEVRPRVSGAVTAIHFTDGASVRAGQLLFTIDPRPFAAALAEARAQLSSADSDLALARADLARAGRLQAEEAVSQSDVDRLNARVRAAVAARAAADARVRARALDIEFTRVRAPISGRISDRRVDAGNLVAAGDGSGTLLTTINALDPIYFRFDGSEALYLKAQRERQAGTGTAQRVEIKLQDEADYRWRGRVDFTDNRLDPMAGTMRGRAVIDNPGYFLTPGMFGNMRLADGGAVQALLVPDAAVRTDQARQVVFVVAGDGTVSAKPVQVGPRIGTLRAIRSGLAAADRVVIEGVQYAQPGAKVTPRPGRITLPSGVPANTPAPSTPAASQATLAVR